MLPVAAPGPGADGVRVLRRLTGVSRVRAAIVFAVAYLLCVLAPSAVLAFTDGAALRHCLTGHQHRAAMVRAEAHVHDGHGGAYSRGSAVRGSTHSAHVSGHDHAGAHDHAAAADHLAGPAQASAGDGSGADAGCCGVFCLSAMPAGPIADVSPLTGMRAAAAVAEPGIAGRGPGRIDRPPNISLPQ